MNKSLKILSIIDLVLLLTYGVFRCLSVVNVGFTAIVDRLFAIISFGISFIILISIIIVFLIQKKNMIDDKSRKNSLIMMIVLLVLSVVMPAVFWTIDNVKLKQSSISLDNATTNLTKKVNDLIVSIKNTEDNKYIYLYDDLLEINNELKETIDKGSYITYLDDKARVCIFDGSYKIYGNEGNFKINKVSSNKEKCYYNFADIGETPYQHNEGEYYLKYYINKKYGLEVNSVKTNYDCSAFVACSLKDYEVYTPDGTITAELKVNNNVIEETDNYTFVYVSKLLQKDLIDYMSSNKYIIKSFILSGDSNLTSISNVDINDLNNELWISFTVVIKKDNRTEENMKQIANKMVDWYKNHKVYGSTNFVLLDSKEYDEVNQYNYESIKQKYDVSNLVSCSVKETGEAKID